MKTDHAKHRRAMARASQTELRPARFHELDAALDPSADDEPFVLDAWRRMLSVDDAKRAYTAMLSRRLADAKARTAKAVADYDAQRVTNALAARDASNRERGRCEAYMTSSATPEQAARYCGIQRDEIVAAILAEDLEAAETYAIPWPALEGWRRLRQLEQQTETDQ